MLPNALVYVMESGTGVATASSAFTADQTTAVTTSLTGSAQTVLATFVDLLPIIATIVGVIFGIRFVKSQFNKVGRAR